MEIKNLYVSFASINSQVVVVRNNIDMFKKEYIEFGEVLCKIGVLRNINNPDEILTFIECNDLSDGDGVRVNYSDIIGSVTLYIGSILLSKTGIHEVSKTELITMKSVMTLLRKFLQQHYQGQNKAMLTRNEVNNKVLLSIRADEEGFLHKLNKKDYVPNPLYQALFLNREDAYVASFAYNPEAAKPEYIYATFIIYNTNIMTINMINVFDILYFTIMSLSQIIDIAKNNIINKVGGDDVNHNELVLLHIQNTVKELTVMMLKNME